MTAFKYRQSHSSPHSYLVFLTPFLLALERKVILHDKSPEQRNNNTPVSLALLWATPTACSKAMLRSRLMPRVQFTAKNMNSSAEMSHASLTGVLNCLSRSLFGIGNCPSGVTWLMFSVFLPPSLLKSSEQTLLPLKRAL